MTDVEMFRALARSSPWLWRSVRLTRTDVGRGDGHVRAWIDRPGRMRAVPSTGAPVVVDERARVDHRAAVRVGDGRSVSLDLRHPRDPGAPQPGWRPDGLVAWRPVDVELCYDDPMYVNYQWVAMLDPVELADGVDPDDREPPGPQRPRGVEVLELSETSRLGRPSLAALVRPAETYDPRCACCPLLFSDVSIAIDMEEGAPVPDPMPRTAEAFQVVLDRATGICVQLRDVGGEHDGTGFDVEIEEVDAEYDDAMFAVPARRRRWFTRRRSPGPGASTP